MKRIFALTLCFFLLTNSVFALETYLFAGMKIPRGWADGFKYSAESIAQCERLRAGIPSTAPAKPLIKCIVKIDPNAAPMY